VHLHLIDEHALAGGGIAAVLDLGGDPVALAQRSTPGIPRVAYAGAFLTAAGGYPAGRAWAPTQVVREIIDASTHPGVPGGAATAVDEQASFGASVIKVALNSAAGPVLDPAALAAIIATARERGLPVVAHAEGEGMPQLAAGAGVDAFAHTPFSGFVGRTFIAHAVAAGQVWISTLAIHQDAPEAAEFARVNLAGFAAAGGRVLYGTDLGNGDRPVGVVPEEVAELDRAGVRGAALIAAMADPWPAAEPPSGVCTFIAGLPPEHLDQVAEWLRGATVVPTEELIHDEC
jgi:imidazolonepropionase-like amidohydrolase